MVSDTVSGIVVVVVVVGIVFQLTVFQGGVDCLTISSSPGASLRICDNQECHSGGI